MAFCFAVSLLGIIQHFTSGSEIYWLSDLKIEGDPFGPYVNRNHFAGFVELTLPTGLALMAFRGVRRDLIPLATLLTIVPISALVLSGSRAGIIGFGLEVGILVLLVRSRHAWQGRRATAAAIVALAALALIAWVGTEKAIEKFSSLTVHDVSLGRRVSMFRGAAHIFLDHPIKGCGLGTLVDVFPGYENAYDGRVVDHAHNDYIEGLAETGLLGGLCGIAFLWALYREGRKELSGRAGALLARAPCRCDHGRRWPAAPQLCGFQPADSIERTAFPAASLPGDVAALAVRLPRPSRDRRRFGEVAATALASPTADRTSGVNSEAKMRKGCLGIGEISRLTAMDALSHSSRGVISNDV